MPVLYVGVHALGQQRLNYAGYHAQLATRIVAQIDDQRLRAVFIEVLYRLLYALGSVALELVYNHVANLISVAAVQHTVLDPIDVYHLARQFAVKHLACALYRQRYR